MKKLYPFTIAFVAALILSNGTFAQTGIYTAVRNGNWDNSSGPNPWDPNGKPSDNCANCIITINSGVTVTLNTSLTLSNNTKLLIGTDATLGAAELLIPASGGTGFSSGFNILLDNTGSAGTAKIKLLDASSSIYAVNSGKYDGVLSFNNGYLKLVGVAPGNFFADGSVQSSNSGLFADPLTGPAILSAPGTLPIILSDFEAVSDNNEVDLTWTTSLEINSDHFVIQRSTNGGARWDNLGTVAARGTSSLSVNYSYTDASPAPGVSDYRLQLVDMDGKFAYSVIKVIRNTLVGSVSIYPNPARDYINITLGATDSPANVNIRLISQSGQVLAEKTVNNTGGTKVSLPVGNYPTGNYIVVATGADGAQQVSKLFISK